MTNVTLSLDDRLLESSRAYAKAHGMSLNALLRQLLAQRVMPTSGAWLEEFFALADRAGGNSHGKRWSREELYER